MDIGKISIPFEYICPLFSENKFNSFFTFTHTLPATAKNKSALMHSNRFDTDNFYQYDYQLVIDGFVLIDALAKATVHDDGINITVVSRGIEFVKKAEQRSIRDFDFGSVSVCDQSDSYGVRLLKWRDHIIDVNLTESPEEGTHKFPQIFTAGYDGNYGKDNYPHSKHKHVVNPMADGTFPMNIIFPKAQMNTYEDQWWFYTIAPCIRIQYVFEKLMEYYGFTLKDIELLNEQEFKQAVAFNGVVLDDVVDLGGGLVNSHGLGFNISDFLPETSVLDFFAMIYELTGYSFNVGKGEIRFIDSKKILSKKPSDYSMWYIESSSFDIVDYQAIKVVYSEEKENENLKLQLPIWNMPISSLNPTTGEYILNPDPSHIGVNTNVDEVNTERTLSHYPMKCTFSMTYGYMEDMTAFIQEEAGGFDPARRYGCYEYMPAFVYPYGIQSVKESTEKKIAQPWYVGCIRGQHTTINAPNPSTINGYPISIWPYNYATTTWDDRNITTAFSHDFGSSIYLTAERGTWQRFMKTISVLDNADRITRRAHVPLHVLSNLTRFEDIKHILRDRRGNRIGYLEKVSGQITENGIGEIELTYRVPKVVLSKGDFNDDFSGDYSA